MLPNYTNPYNPYGAYMNTYPMFNPAPAYNRGFMPMEQNQPQQQTTNGQQVASTQTLNNNMSQQNQSQDSNQQQSFYTTSLNGKVVDGVDIVKVTEIPYGGYGVFPKADLSDIYVKVWNNGATEIIDYKPCSSVQNNTNSIESNNTINTLVTKIDKLEQKIDGLLDNSINSIEKIIKPEEVTF